jgi:nitric oxide reductase NorQ protein
MIAELVALGASIRDAIIFSLQTTKEHLESILLTLHLENGIVDENANEFVLFSKKP